ncbi:hypothetical protein [Dysgonomonas sp. 521]|uniref:LIC_10190 family membrane protein n=1 Tax=Dysgonomonas sp. 521 TaxID=2302932 RepID=UPI0013D356F7|nr:hypothetical protein [Dysgonomonas sp. 521]
MAFCSDFYDANVYHHQQIRWNEEFGVVPGLANIEDRFGFNSNYLLISAVFSFRFLFGEALNTIQSLLFVAITFWILIQIFKTNYGIAHIIALFFMLLILFTNSTLLNDSSTDIIPLLCIFYFIIKTVSAPDWLVKQPFLASLLPVIMVTYKLSTSVFCLISLGILIYLFRQGKLRNIFFILIISILCVLVWCIRNVVITGYLVYPFESIDLFSFDWKMPKASVQLERLHVQEWANWVFSYLFEIKRNRLIINVTNYSMFILAVLSPIVVIYSWIKKVKISNSVYYIYAVSMLCLFLGMMTAPDFRFVGGYLFGCGFILVYSILKYFKVDETTFPVLGKIAISFIIVCALLFVTDMNYRMIITSDYTTRDLSYIWWKQKRFDYKTQYTEYNMNGLTIYLIDREKTCTFDVLPSTTSYEGIPFTPFKGLKLQSINTVEARGDNLQDGFRTKKEYVDIINDNVEEYIKAYLKRYEQYNEPVSHK